MWPPEEHTVSNLTNAVLHDHFQPQRETLTEQHHFLHFCNAVFLFYCLYFLIR